MARLAQFSRPEVGPFDVGASEIRQGPIGTHEAGVTQIGTTEIGAGEIGMAQHCVGEVRAPPTAERNSETIEISPMQIEIILPESGGRKIFQSPQATEAVGSPRLALGAQEFEHFMVLPLFALGGFEKVNNRGRDNTERLDIADADDIQKVAGQAIGS